MAQPRELLETFRCQHPEAGYEGFEFIAHIDVDHEKLKEMLVGALATNKRRRMGERVINRGPFRVRLYEQRRSPKVA